MKAIAAIVITGFGMYLLNWTDPVHLFVSVPVLGAGWLMLTALARRIRDDADGDDESEDEIGPQVFRGVLTGMGALVLLAVTFFGASRTPLYGYFYDQDCNDILAKVKILEEANAFEITIASLDQRLAGKASAKCRGQLIDKKVRTLITWADALTGSERLTKLKEAKNASTNHTSADLGQLIETKLLNETQRQEIEKAKEMLKKLDLAMKVTDRGLVVDLPDVFFESGSAALTDPARQKIKEIAEMLNDGDFREKTILFEGHTDNAGDARINKTLSQERAENASSVAVDFGVAKHRVSTRGFGADKPKAPNDTAEGRAKNRRVEMIILS
jgi:outer membrane protein OmpA-like peptidoglycan-associated protein